MSQPRRALVLVDVQNEYFNGPLEIQYPPREESLATILRAIDTAESNDIPVVLVEHKYPEGFPVFAPDTEGQRTHPEIESRVTGDWHRITKSFSSIFPGTGLDEWIRDNDIDTLTLVGYMSNNCVLATSVESESRGLKVEVLSDATGAINLGNEAGTAGAQQVHETLMTLLNSNFAAVGGTDAWARAVVAGAELPGSNLIVSAS